MFFRKKFKFFKGLYSWSWTYNRNLIFSCKMESGTPVLALWSLENLKFVCVMLLLAFELIFQVFSVPYHFAYAMHLLPS
jgi:hypothetical protein